VARRRHDPAALEPPAHLVGDLVVADWVDPDDYDPADYESGCYRPEHMARLAAHGEAARLRTAARREWSARAGLTEADYRRTFPVRRRGGATS
jgi:hypothetical protein